MHVHELAMAVLKQTPDISVHKLVGILTDYGRSSKFAARMNEKLHIDNPVEDKLYCAKHYDLYSDLEDYAAHLEVSVTHQLW